MLLTIHPAIGRLQDAPTQPIIAINMINKFRFAWSKKRLLIPLLCVTVLVGWLYETPPGLLGKADAIGYAVCHRIDIRSFHLDERPLPLCARCSGMFIGALIGLVYQQIRFSRFGGMPTLKTGLPFILFFAAWAFDGVNSYLHLIPGAPGLYTPNNTFRLLTGIGMGLALAVILFPAFNQAVWSNYDPRHIFTSWRPYLEMISLGFGIGALFLTDIPILLYPLGILSAAGILVILSAVYSLIWLMVFRTENQAETWMDLWIYLSAGLLTAMIQIGLIDIIRFWFTRTWNGFNI